MQTIIPQPNKNFSRILTGEGGTSAGLLEGMFVLFVRHDTVIKKISFKLPS
jgi:hypothetical protein